MRMATESKSRLGTYVTTTVTGEPVQAFIPPPLPQGCVGLHLRQVLGLAMDRRQLLPWDFFVFASHPRAVRSP